MNYIYIYINGVLTHSAFQYKSVIEMKKYNRNEKKEMRKGLQARKRDLWSRTKGVACRAGAGRPNISFCPGCLTWD